MRHVLLVATLEAPEAPELVVAVELEFNAVKLIERLLGVEFELLAGAALTVVTEAIADPW